MKHLQYLHAVLLLTVSSAAWAQFNPENPDEPGTHPWRLTLKAVPATGGYYNVNAQTMHAAGEEVYLYAYSHSDFSFVQWEDEQGAVLSTNSNLTYCFHNKVDIFGDFFHCKSLQYGIITAKNLILTFGFFAFIFKFLFFSNEFLMLLGLFRNPLFNLFHVMVQSFTDGAKCA